jgi:hypothetical protein
LFRGDASDAVAVPTPEARLSIVEHVLLLGSYGRATPFTSTTEFLDHAEHFAKDGAVWQTLVAAATAAGGKHWSRKTLLENLRGFGKGKAKWTNKYEVAQAALNVTRWSEHLLDWSNVSPKSIDSVIKAVFSKRPRKRGRK